MERSVIFRDRQELQPADLNNVEDFADESLRDVVRDAITAERQIVGMVVNQKSATEIEIAPGRLYDGTTGKVYALREAITESVFSQLPIADEKWLAVSVIGQEVNTDVQPRDFLIDLQTGQTQPDSVAMETRRNAVVNIAAGIESSTPQKPAAPTGYTLLAYVRLNTSGIQEIQLGEVFALPNLQNVAARLKSVEGWRGLAEPTISTLKSDVANLNAKVQQQFDLSRIVEIAGDVALLKERNEINSGATSYSADYFLNRDQSDTADLTYYARVDEGIRFPWDGEAEVTPTLFNPFESAVKQFNGFVLPDYDEAIRLATVGYAGELPIAQYQVQSQTFTQLTRSRERVRYGPSRVVCTNSEWWRSGRYDPVTGNFYINGDVYEVDVDISNSGWQYAQGAAHLYLRVRQVWIDRWAEPYWEVNQTTTTYNGAQVAQTFLNSQSGWLTKLGLYFTRVDAAGAMNVAICETERGLPLLDRTIAMTQIAVNAMKQFPLESAAIFPEPVYLEAGKRYAIVLTTQGNHRAAIVSGTEYTEGTLFYSLDGEYQQGDFTKDLMFAAYFAKFKNLRTIVQLSGLQLAGGIADLDLLNEVIAPESTQFLIEYQRNGVWYGLTPDTAAQLNGLPALLPMRAVFVGSSDLMPGLNLGGSRWRAARPAVTFRHVSEERTIPTASDEIVVKTLLEDFDDEHHTFAVKLDIGGVETSATTVVDTIEDTGIKRTSTFNLGAPTANFQIITEGTTDAALTTFHVAFRIDVAL